MLRACVSIGVNQVSNAPTLPVLRAAADGADRFAAWAGQQGFEAFAFTDKSGALDIRTIKRQIAAIVQAGTYSQLVIYFAGHGLLRTWDTEVWLLSDAAQDSNEAV